MLGKFPRIRPIVFEGRPVSLVGMVGIWFEVYSLNVEQLFQYCGKAARG